MSQSCLVCGKRAYSDYCVQHKPRKPLKTNKPIRRIGKKAQEWIEYRHEWIKRNSGREWHCIIGGALLTLDTLTLDHDVPRSRDTTLRVKDSNINEMCWYHNSDKGSKSLAEYLATNPDLHCRFV